MFNRAIKKVNISVKKEKGDEFNLIKLKKGPIKRSSDPNLQDPSMRFELK